MSLTSSSALTNSWAFGYMASPSSFLWIIL
jgi:hypothetical protein